MNPTVIRAMVLLRLKRVFSDRSSLIWLFVMPMVFSFLMGQLMGNWGSSGPVSKPTFLVYDKDKTPVSEQLLNSLEEHERFKIVRSDSIVSKEKLLAAIDDGRITAALQIPAGFSASLNSGQKIDLELYFDSDRLSSQSVRTLLDGSVYKLNTDIAAESLVVSANEAGGVPTDKSGNFDREIFEEQWSNPRLSLSVTTLGRAEVEEFPLTDSSQHLGPAYTIFFIMMFLMMSAKDLVTERKDQTLARLMTSHASSMDLVMGFFLGGLTLGIIQGSLLLALNSLAFGIDYGNSPAGLILVVLLFSAVSSAASVLLGSVARTNAQSDGLGMVFTMIMASLGGLWWPLEIVPQFMQDIGKSLPSGQAITVFHDMIGRGYGVAELSSLFIGLGIWFLVLMALASWRLRRLVAV